MPETFTDYSPTKALDGITDMLLLALMINVFLFYTDWTSVLAMVTDNGRQKWAKIEKMSF